VAQVRHHHATLAFRRAAAETRAIWVRANGYLQETAPWTVLKTDPARAAVVTRTALNLIRIAAVTAWSIVPTLSQEILAALEADAAIPPWPTTPERDLLACDRAGRPIDTIGPLVAKITEERVAHLQSRFGAGEQPKAA
jgi:methionyl-tRNA synthetase